MAKIFISYKYADKCVRQNRSYNNLDWLLGVEGGNYLTARDYVTHLMGQVLTDHTNKAEKDNEDLGVLTEDVIQKKLSDRIYDSTVTIVLISKKMKEEQEEKNQWISWEISYSLKEKTREDRTSYTNGILAIALPDENGSYDHAVVNKTCGLRSWRTDSFFQIVGKNMFNKIDANHSDCRQCYSKHHHGTDHSYIHPVKWDDFVKDHNRYINIVLDLKDRLDEFDLTKALE